MIVLTANGEVKEHITGITATPPLDLTGDILSLATPLAAQYGGTGINNGLNSLTLGAAIEIDSTGAAASNVLAFDGSKWVPSAAGTGTVSGGGTAPKIPKWTAAAVLGDSIISETTSGITLTITQGNATSGSPHLIVVNGGAHTTLDASAEATDIQFILNRGVQFSTGALTTQRAVVFAAPSYTFVGPSTITTAATVAITGSPIAGANATITNPLALWIQSGNVLIGTTVFPLNAALYVQQASITSGTPTAFIVSGGAHTTLAASVEAFDVNFNLNRSVQFAQGALTTQRAVVFQAPTYAFATGAATITTAATVAITGAPAAGTNASITDTLALWVQAGRTVLGGNPVYPTVTRSVLEVAGTAALVSGVTSSNALLVASTVQAFANSDTLRAALLYPIFAKGALTGLVASVLYLDSPTPTGAGTISKYAVLQAIEQTYGTANIGILIGTHPGGSANYAAYFDSSNDVFLGTGRVNIGTSTFIAGIEFIVHVAANENLWVRNSSGTLQLEAANDAGAANVQMNYAATTHVFLAGGVQVGAPTGGNKGVGTINTAGDIYKNNSAYGNPAYALEWWATGRISRYADREGAAGYRRPTLEESELYIRERFELPGHRDDFGIFGGGEWMLEKLEEVYTYMIELHHRVNVLEGNFR